MAPQLVQRDGRTYARLGQIEVWLERSHQDKKKPAYWRARDGTGKVLTAWHFTAKIAACRALLP
jgi:hypothetical protein